VDALASKADEGRGRLR